MKTVDHDMKGFKRGQIPNICTMQTGTNKTERKLKEFSVRKWKLCLAINFLVAVCHMTGKR